MTSAVLEVQGVTKAYGDAGVLRGVDIAVHEHQAVALIGASGSGKSTLLRCIDLLEEIDDGDVLLDGQVITDPSVNPVPVRRRLGLVFQAFNLFPHLTVLENVLLAPARAQGMPRPEATKAAHELLARFGLDAREDDYPDRLSGGQQQRVAISIVIPSAFSSRTTSSTSPTSSGSSALVISSSSSARGRVASARMIATRCC